MTKVCLGIPTTGTFQADVVVWLLSQSTNPEYRTCAEVSVGCVGHARQRNIVVQRFLETDATHLFFLDDDVVPPKDAIPRMLAHDKDVMTGVVPRFDREAGGTMPMVYHLKPGATRQSVLEEEEAFAYAQPTTDGLERVDGSGGGCWLLRREVFERMSSPWFDNLDHGDVAKVLMGEDLFFCLRLHEEGIPMYVDWSIRCKHYKRIPLY